jgi:hypothetical protein
MYLLLSFPVTASPDPECVAKQSAKTSSIVGGWVSHESKYNDVMTLLGRLVKSKKNRKSPFSLFSKKPSSFFEKSSWCEGNSR